MDLRFQKHKSEIIKKVQSCENEHLLQDILSQLTEDDEFSAAVEPLTKDQLAAKIQAGLDSIQRGETYTTEEVVAFLKHHGRKV
jgi:predicted transcriptional regulator